PVAVEPVAEAPAPDEAVPAAGIPLRSRLVSAAERGSAPWLAEAITRLAALEHESADRLVVRLLPVQRLRVANDLVYDLTVTELGTFRVTLRDGETTVEPVAEPGGRKDVDFHLEGTAPELAQFAAGGMRKRPKGTHLEGSRRRLKRLIKDLREPVQLSDIARAGAVVEPGLILAALAAGMELEWTTGHTFTVAWVIGGEHGGTWTVRIGDGLPQVLPGLPEEGATATLHVPQQVFIPLLAGFAPPPGEEATASGNAHAVALLRQWFDQVQQLS
ncbi:MAG: Chromosome segregation ATPase-like protein, partial [Solirubrobacteraceae bacterium]|nr:Chromosome segregation ATPase-like protein [Solirubrobacteraceae bacterium]